MLRSVWLRLCKQERNLRGVLELEVLVREFGTVDGLSTGSIASGEVSTSTKRTMVRQTRDSNGHARSRQRTGS